MAYDLAAISSERVLRPPRIIVLGIQKIGKSTFAADSIRPFVVQVKGEEGVDDMAVAKTPVCQSYDDVVGWWQTLRTQEHNYGTVVLDSASAFEPLVHAKTCQMNGNAESIEKVNGGYGKGYTEALKYWRLATEYLDCLRNEKGMASIIIGHVRTKRFDDPCGDSYDQYEWDIHKTASSWLYKWADLIMFCNTKVIVRKEEVGFNKEKARGMDLTGARFLFTQNRPAHPGGGRGVFGRLPYELPLSWAAFCEAVAAASAL